MLIKPENMFLQAFIKTDPTDLAEYISSFSRSITPEPRSETESHNSPPKNEKTTSLKGRRSKPPRSPVKLQREYEGIEQEIRALTSTIPATSTNPKKPPPRSTSTKPPRKTKGIKTAPRSTSTTPGRQTKSRLARTPRKPVRSKFLAPYPGRSRSKSKRPKLPKCAPRHRSTVRTRTSRNSSPRSPRKQSPKPYPGFRKPRAKISQTWTEIPCRASKRAKTSQTPHEPSPRRSQTPSTPTQGRPKIKNSRKALRSPRTPRAVSRTPRTGSRTARILQKPFQTLKRTPRTPRQVRTPTSPVRFQSAFRSRTPVRITTKGSLYIPHDRGVAQTARVKNAITRFARQNSSSTTSTSRAKTKSKQLPKFKPSKPIITRRSKPAPRLGFPAATKPTHRPASATSPRSKRSGSVTKKSRLARAGQKSTQNPKSPKSAKYPKSRPKPRITSTEEPPKSPKAGRDIEYDSSDSSDQKYVATSSSVPGPAAKRKNSNPKRPRKSSPKRLNAKRSQSTVGTRNRPALETRRSRSVTRKQIVETQSRKVKGVTITRKRTLSQPKIKSAKAQNLKVGGAVELNFQGKICKVYPNGSCDIELPAADGSVTRLKNIRPETLGLSLPTPGAPDMTKTPGAKVYKSVHDKVIRVRECPSAAGPDSAPRGERRIFPDEEFEIDEERIVGGISWVRISDGSGWVFEQKNGQNMIEQCN